VRPRNLRKPTPRRCAAYWDDYIAAWRAVGAAAAQHLDDPGPPEDMLAAMIEAAVDDPTRRILTREEIGPWIDGLPMEEVADGVFVIESDDPNDGRPF
jgi:hypothetical protein